MSDTKNRVRISLFGGYGTSLEWAQQWLERYAEETIPRCVVNGLDRIGYYAEAQAEGEYGDAEITVSHETERNRLFITAEGPEVVFWEFGTGTYAEASDHELSGGTTALGFDVSPGSWSYGPEGKRTYKAVEEKRISMDKWPYAKIPRRGMLAAYNGVKRQYENLMQGAFDE